MPDRVCSRCCVKFFGGGKRFVLTGICALTLLLPSISAAVTPDKQVTVDDLPSNASAITTGNYYPGFNRLAIWYGDGGCYGWFKGAEDTELTLNADQTMTSTSDGYGAGWDGTYKMFTNNGTLNVATTNSTINEALVSKTGFLQIGRFVNNGSLVLKDLKGKGATGFQNKGAFENYGTVKVIGSSGLSAKGFLNSDTVTNYDGGMMDITGGSNGSTYGFTGGTLTNQSGGTITATGGSGSSAAGIRETTLQNKGTLIATGGSGSLAAGVYDVNLTNSGDITFVGSDNYITAYGAYSSSSVTTTNNAGATINVQGSSGTAVGWRDAGTTVNDGTMNVTANTAGGWTIYGTATNNGIMNLSTTVANQAIKVGANGTYSQISEKAKTSGNLLSFMDYTCPDTDSDSGSIAYIKSDGTVGHTTEFSVATGDSQFSIGTLASFLTSNISAGTLTITDTDWSAEVQATIKEAIYAAGVGAGVNITFGGTGTKDGTEKIFNYSKFVNSLSNGSLFPEFDLTFFDNIGSRSNSGRISGNVDINYDETKDGPTIYKSFGVKTVSGADRLLLANGAKFQILGNGEKILDGIDSYINGADQFVSVDSTSLLILGSDNPNISSQQGGTLTVPLNLAGNLQVSGISNLYNLKETVTLSESAKLTNAGHINVERLAFNTPSATVTNSGVMRVVAVTTSQVGSTLKNIGTYAQTDLTAFGDIQNKGTLKTGALKVGAADKLVNGGTILAEKITVDGLFQNRNGTFALGTAAVAKYLKNHLDLAQQLKDLGETLPTSVENMLTAQADAEATSLTTLELTDSERPVESDDETAETVEGTDLASWLATMQTANAPQGRLVTRKGRLVFAGLSTYADNQAQLERQLQSGISGLWADVIASQSEMDGYKANRSGIAVGLQGTNDAGVTFGVAARYSDGKLKGDSLTSENWTSAGGSAYAAWANDDVFVSGFIGYDNLKTKGSDKLTNDVVSAGVKTGIKFDVGPVHVTPFVGGEVVHQKVKGVDAATTYRFPMGVGLTGQYETYGAWQVHPSLEVAFVPQAGDKVIDLSDKVDSRFVGNYAVESRVGIAVEKKNLLLGINYHGSAGDAGIRSHSLQANVKYRF